MKKLTLLFSIVVLATRICVAQSSAFTYQGKLTDAGAPANGNYDLRFALFDNLAGGAQVGATQTVNTVAVSAGIFTVSLDFGANAFSGANRFLEIGVRTAGGGAFTVLAPRQPISSTPYAIRSANATTADTAKTATNATNATTATNATQLGGVAANQYVVTSDSRLTDSRAPTPGSSSYVQNTTSTQASSNFNVSGNGTANIFNATTQFNIGGQRVLSASTNNLFVGVGAGTNNTGGANSFVGSFAGDSNTTGSHNSFFGRSAGVFNTTGESNSFFGRAAGLSNTTGNDNSFFGTNAGFSNTIGNSNSFFGRAAGFSNTEGFGNSFSGVSAGERNTTGHDNSFFGKAAGTNNTTGSFNSFFGEFAGVSNTTGHDNSSFGRNAGFFNTTGESNSFFGKDAGFSNTTESNNTFIGSISDGQASITNATAIGYRAKVTQSNSLVLGSVNTVNGATADTNVGIGTTAPEQTLHVNGMEILSTGALSGFKFRNRGSTSSADDWVWYSDGNLARFFRAGVGDLLTITAGGIVSIKEFGRAGGTSLCRNGLNEISDCSSSLRYKTGLQPFVGGLDIVRRLRPISFAWKQGGARDIGLGAEEVEEVEPLLTFRNDKGEIEGVKYNQLSAVFINAFKEQQAQIKQQQERIKQQEQQASQHRAALISQQQQLDALKKLVCRSHRRAAVCK